MNPRLLLLAAVAFVLLGGCFFLATRDIPAPRHLVEKALGNDRFIK